MYGTGTSGYGTNIGDQLLEMNDALNSTEVGSGTVIGYALSDYATCVHLDTAIRCTYDTL